MMDWWPKDAGKKLLWTGVFLALVVGVLGALWWLPWADVVQATVTRLEAAPEGVEPALVTRADAQQFPFLKQSAERAEKNNGTAESNLPGRAWEGWKRRVAEVQPGKDPTVIEWQGRLYRFTAHEG